MVRHDPVSILPKRRQWLDSNPGAFVVKRAHNHGAVQRSQFSPTVFSFRSTTNVLWTSSCSHCEKQYPYLYQLIGLLDMAAFRWANPGLFFIYFRRFRTENWSSNRDSNSDCWSRRQERWTQDHHHHGPIGLLSTDTKFYNTGTSWTKTLSATSGPDFYFSVDLKFLFSLKPV